MKELRGGVGRQVQAVEAGVGARQRLGPAPALDAEAPRARGAPQRREALVRDGRRARHELDQSQTLLVREPADKFIFNKPPILLRLKIMLELASRGVFV